MLVAAVAQPLTEERVVWAVLEVEEMLEQEAQTTLVMRVALTQAVAVVAARVMALALLE